MTPSFTRFRGRQVNRGEFHERSSARTVSRFRNRLRGNSGTEIRRKFLIARASAECVKTHERKQSSTDNRQPEQYHSKSRHDKFPPDTDLLGIFSRSRRIAAR